MNITYMQANGYCIPNLAAPNIPNQELGIWGQRRFIYLKTHKRILFTQLLTSGNLHDHLFEIDQTATTRHEQIVVQMMQSQGITEQLKEDNQML